MYWWRVKNDEEPWHAGWDDQFGMWGVCGFGINAGDDHELPEDDAPPEDERCPDCILELRIILGDEGVTDADPVV